MQTEIAHTSGGWTNISSVPVAGRRTRTVHAGGVTAIQPKPPTGDPTAVVTFAARQGLPLLESTACRAFVVPLAPVRYA